MEYSDLKIIPGAGPFYFKGNSVGFLIIHGGGGGTCADLKPLAQDLNKERGYTIKLPLLPGYGTSPRDLRRTPISSWRFALENEVKALREECEKIIIGGHSMGGLLALILAANFNFDALFTINAPIGIRRFGLFLVPFINIFMKYHSINSVQLKKETNGRWVGYDKIPINIGVKVKKLIRETKMSLPKIFCPAIFFQGCLDSEIKKESLNYIFNNINTQHKKKIWLKNNDHSILDSPDHKQIVLGLTEFIDKICT
ncbi:hypothetical protein LCGC14_1320150 [marine sediment metagenome]|uniref:AB hydrolase-1 domain-containing protein n=1 Tax=marine sediment metagenome TaxID=412755 RepID=A0A0F9NM46_9ZZZZ